MSRPRGRPKVDDRARLEAVADLIVQEPWISVRDAVRTVVSWDVNAREQSKEAACRRLERKFRPRQQVLKTGARRRWQLAVGRKKWRPVGARGSILGGNALDLRSRAHLERNLKARRDEAQALLRKIEPWVEGVVNAKSVDVAEGYRSALILHLRLFADCLEDETGLILEGTKIG